MKGLRVPARGLVGSQEAERPLEGPHPWKLLPRVGGGTEGVWVGEKKRPVGVLHTLDSIWNASDDHGETLVLSHLRKAGSSS